MKPIRFGPRIDLQLAKDLSNIEYLQSHGEIEAKEESWQEKDKLDGFFCSTAEQNKSLRSSWRRSHPPRTFSYTDASGDGIKLGEIHATGARLTRVFAR